MVVVTRAGRLREWSQGELRLYIEGSYDHFPENNNYLTPNSFKRKDQIKKTPLIQMKSAATFHVSFGTGRPLFS